jgi:hypothetical protein
LQLTVTPWLTLPVIEQLEQELAQAQVIGPLPQPLSTQRAKRAPPAVTEQICPDAQLMLTGLAHCTASHAPTSTLHEPLLQVAALRPTPAQSS